MYKFPIGSKYCIGLAMGDCGLLPIGNCNTSAEQMILVMNETKQYEIWAIPKG